LSIIVGQVGPGRDPGASGSGPFGWVSLDRSDRPDCRASGGRTWWAHLEFHPHKRDANDPPQKVRGFARGARACTTRRNRRATRDRCRR